MSSNDKPSSLTASALRYHAHRRPGKIEVIPTKGLETQRDLSLAYSPGVAAPCRAIFEKPDDVFKYTAKGNLVAVVTNGTAVLGLGDIGPLAGKPVMEGKANLFKKFADIDVFDIELDARTADEVVAAVKAMAPTFGGINLEDIKAPECFEIERRLQDELDIPVFHDDQHGTAIISAAALINACQLTDRSFGEIKVTFCGAGAAAMACARLYVALGVRKENITMCDSKGVIYKGRPNTHEATLEFAQDTDKRTLAEAMVGADGFIGLSAGNLVSEDMVRSMADRPIIFAMANPDPEIAYATAKRVRPDAIIATGRSDHPNQVNNVLGFPFVFRGALDCHARKITDEMKLAATHAIAALAREDVPDNVLDAYGLDRLAFGPDYIIPKPFDARVLLHVAPAVAKAAEESGVARHPIKDLEGYREHLYRLVVRSRGLMTPMIQRARANTPTRIVFTDGYEPKVLRAAQILAEERICTPILLGREDKVRRLAQSLGLDLRGVEIDSHDDDERNESFAQVLWKKRQRRGITLSRARDLVRDRQHYGVLLVDQGFADGMVGGLGRPYKHTLQPAIRLLGTKPGVSVVSGVYAMIIDDNPFFMGDCTVNLYPDAPTLAQIARNTAKVATDFGVTPRVAMLSYSDYGEHRNDPNVAKVGDAVKIVRELDPTLEIDGEMQADTAVFHPKMVREFPFAELTGPANTLVFPDLTSGNITYKLAEHLANAERVGPLLVGLSRPVNVIPVHATVEMIVNVATYTAVQALETAQG